MIRKENSKGYSNAIDAFDFRFSLGESSNAEKKLNEWYNDPNLSYASWNNKSNYSSMTSNLQLRSNASNDCNPNNSLYGKIENIKMLMSMKIQNWVRQREFERKHKLIQKIIKDCKCRETTIGILTNKLQQTEPWRHLILGAGDKEIAASISQFDKDHVAMKARHIIDALSAMNRSSKTFIAITWVEACKEAIKHQCSNYHFRTVMNWYLDLHLSSSNGDIRFPKSKKGYSSSAAISPFSQDECLMIQFKSWAKSDLENLTIEKATNWINNNFLNEWTAKELTNYKISYPVSKHIVASWMKEAGFHYAGYKKSYYVDRHEDPDVVIDREKYILRCFEDELYEACWIQMPYKDYLRTQRKRIQNKCIDDEVTTFVEKMAYVFSKHKNQKEQMIEMHVDLLHSLPATCRPTMSVHRKHKNRKELVVFGQEECIFRSSQLNEKTWFVDGKARLRSKGLGRGIMVSSFCSRKFGFSMEISESDLDRVNQYRSTFAITYKETEAAMFLLGSKVKPALQETPFLRLLEHGQGRDGYWTYNHMILQIEDCIDCMNVLFEDPNERNKCKFDLCFELDHSSGHSKERLDGLSTTRTILNTRFGGSQRLMRDSVLTHKCFGTVSHNRRLKVGNVQKMIFQKDDLPPITDPSCPPYDLPRGTFSTKRITAAEMRTALERDGKNIDGSKKKLLERCNNAGIATLKTVEQIIPGYVGKAKGAFQIAFERGFCDENLNLNGEKVSADGKELCEYSDKQKTIAMNISELREMLASKNIPCVSSYRKDLMALCVHNNLPTTTKIRAKKRDLKYSVYHFLSRCEDFQNECTQMEMVLKERLGVSLRMTPKCHPEIAGVGIEYCWGYAKLRFRKHFNDSIANNLEKNVRDSLSKSVLTKTRTDKFARKAREYKLTYLYLVKEKALSHERIELITKQFKQHRSALDSDYKFIVNA